MPKFACFSPALPLRGSLSYPPFSSSSTAIGLPRSSIPLCHLVTFFFFLPTGQDTHGLPEFLTLLARTAQDLAPFLLSYHISSFLFGSLLCSLPAIPRAHLAISKAHYVSLDSRPFLLACSSAWTLYLSICTWITSYPL